MKTRNFSLYVAILMMVAVTTAAGQPARGQRNGNHEKNNRREVKADANKPAQDARKIRFDGNSSERGSVNREMRVNDRLTSREQTPQKEKKASSDENRNSGSKKDRAGLKDNRNSNENRARNSVNSKELENQGVSSNNRNYREEPASNNRGYSRNDWGRGNNDRHEWENRKYNWNEHKWNFSNYYRKGYIPYYFRNNRNYWYFPGYGHILRGFPHNPYLFYSGRIPFYFADGFFYRYHEGIGYVWIEDPYDLRFNELPYGAERIRIGRRIYFRLGNAYFEASRHGFQLVLLPDRYYNPNDDRGVGFEISARF